MAEKKIATIITTKVICKEPGIYIGWPTIAKTHNGELLVVFSGDRDAHVCPFGKTEMVRSSDAGKTWTEPFTINNTPLDDRDAGIVRTREGTLVVSWFTSLAFQNTGNYNQQVQKITPAIRQKWHGHWVRRSVDGGKTWGEFIRTNVNAPHGPIQLRDGQLLYLGNGIVDGKSVLAAEASSDDGRTWQILGTVPIPDTMKYLRFCEAHVVEADGGKLVGMFRVEPPEMEERYLYQSESFDGGRTWTKPHQTTVWGYPPHLTRLKNGWLLVVYGRRIPPYGERACLSLDEGKTWNVENEIVLCDASNNDLGYPASVQLDDGSILTVYYQIDKPGEKTSLMCTHWRLE